MIPSPFGALAWGGARYRRAGTRRRGRAWSTKDVKTAIGSIGINKCARESGFDRKNFIRKLVRDIPVKRNSYMEFVRWLTNYASRIGLYTADNPSCQDAIPS